MATKKRRTKPKIDRAVDRLYRAVDFYVKSRGGSLVVIGGIQVQEWPGDPAGKYRIAVECLGRKPELPPKGSDK